VLPKLLLKRNLLLEVLPRLLPELPLQPVVLLLPRPLLPRRPLQLPLLDALPHVVPEWQVELIQINFLSLNNYGR
jgi:hypothetical protein